MNKLCWVLLLHLGYNMWKEKDALFTDEDLEYVNASDKLICDTSIWNEITGMIPKCGIVTLVIDIGEGIRYQSHPEIAIEGSWSVERFKEELIRLRNLGITPMPKLNFSTCHDVWLAEYSRCVSTKKYYQVCKNL